MPTDDLSRRRALGLTAALLATGTAGCQSDDGGPTGETTSPTPDDTEGSATETPTETPSTDDTGADDGTDGTGNGDTASETDPETTVADTITARRVASGFVSPVAVEIPQSGRRFVVDQSGQIYLQDSEGVRDDPFLDVSDRMVSVDGLTEKGLLGLAFHPEFADNGRFFVRYSAPNREGTPDDYSHTFVPSEFHADPNAATADPDSERAILEIPEPQRNHNAGDIAFGPDGYLYVAVGDGGAGNDQGRGHVEDWYDAVGGGNGQDVTENLLGSVLRIDPDSSQTVRGEERNYAIPDDNPLVGAEGLDEHFAWGFRNPWRMSFGPNGRLFVADVGQGAWEEVSVVEKGGNYGWNVKEGTHCFAASDCPSESPDGRELRDPVIEYPHSDAEVRGISVIGGYLYDGDDMPAFDGQYLFADWRAAGDLFAARDVGDGLWPTRVVSVESDAEFGPNVLAFGRNPAGELFVCTTAETGVTGDTGAVFRLGVDG